MGHHVLQIHGRGAAGLPHQRQEAVKVPVGQGLGLLPGPQVLAVEVERPQRGPVAGGGPDLGQLGEELLLGDLPEDLLAKAAADGLELVGDSGVLAGQIRVTSAGIQDAQAIARRGQVQGDLLHHRMGGVGKVNGHHAAHRGGGLIHQPAGLAEEDVLRVLADLSDLHRGVLSAGEEVKVNGHHAAHRGGGLIHQPAGLAEEDVLRVLADLSDLHRGVLSAGEEVIEHGAHQHLKGGGGAQPAAAGNGGGHAHIQAPALQRAAQLDHPGGHAADQCGGGVDFFRTGRQLPQVHDDGGVALGLDADHAGVVGRGGGQDVQIHGGGQDPAMLMVRVIAAHFRAAGGAEQGGGLCAEGLGELFQQLSTAAPGGFQGGLAVQPGQGLVQVALCEQRFGIGHDGPSYVLLASPRKSFRFSRVTVV